MEDIKSLVKEANTLVNTADHLTYITYPTVKDNKLMISIIEDLYKALVKGVNAVLQYERMYKRISPYSDNFDAKLEVFKSKCATRYNIDRQLIILINDLKQIMEHREKSFMEFSKKDKFIMSAEDYRTRSISIEKLKEYLSKSKIFIEKVNDIVKENDRRV